jgi:opacity protein-like surface antigen
VARSLTGSYRIHDGGGGAPAVAVGGLVSLTGDSWRNTVNAPSSIATCAERLPASFDATALSIFAIASAGFALAPRLSVVGTGGVGVAAYMVPHTGGDLFVPSCTSSPGLRPALFFGAQLDYALGKTFRLTAMPLSLQLHPAFAGVRTSPIDAGGVWMRFGMAVGIGVDL